jgi:hypothetical protein
MEIENIAIRTPEKGDVIWAVGFPFHCGIYESDDSVIHFAPANGSKTKKDAVIHKSTLTEFAKNHSVVVIEFSPEKCLPPEESIRRAYSRLGENTYNLILNNCEHFAIWCKIGEHRSPQIDLVKEIAVAVCKLIDKSGEKNTEFGKSAEIFGKLHEVVQILTSPESRRNGNLQLNEF